MAYMRRLLKQYCGSGKHMNSAVLLHIAAVLDNYLAPVAPDGRARPHVNIFTYDHVSRNRSIRVYKGGAVDHGPVPVEFKNVWHDLVCCLVKIRFLCSRPVQTGIFP